MSDNGLVGATASITQTVALWTVLLPPVSEVRRHVPGTDPTFIDDVRYSEIVVAALSGTISLVLSRLEHSWTPFLACLFLVTVLVIAYEYTLRRPGYAATVTPIRYTTEG